MKGAMDMGRHSKGYYQNNDMHGDLAIDVRPIYREGRGRRFYFVA